MPKLLTLFVAFLLLHTLLHAQREYNITSLDQFPNFDGHYQHPAWQLVAEMEEFVAFFPNPGQKPGQSTQVKIAYTRSGIYVLAHCQSTKVRNDGSARDYLNEADYISVRLDTWMDRQNYFDFTVTAAGQLYDARSHNGEFDVWWQAKTRIVDNGWVAEIFIPFTALRFPDKGEQLWGLQVTRFDRSTGETSSWNPQNPYINDDSWQYGTLTGLGNLKQKIRLGLAMLSQFGHPGIADYNIGQLTVGLDGRLGLGASSTLDFSIFPNTALLTPALDGGGFLNVPSPGYPEPRQYAADEAQVYHKTQLFYPDFNLDGSWFYQNTPLLPGETLTGIFAPNKRQSTTLSSRMRGGVGLVASNVIYAVPETFYASQFPFSSSIRPIELGRPNHTNLSIEKLLRNNSWINFSQNVFVVGNDFIKNQSGLSMQLRDKSNQYQLAASGQTNYEGSNDYAALSIGKVNGPWTWGLNYNHRSFSFRGAFGSGSRSEYEYIHLWAAKTNFQPRYRGWLRTRHYASLRRDDGFSQTTPGIIGGAARTTNVDDRYFVRYSYDVLNRKFETFGAGLTFVPDYSERAINILGGEFRANRYVPIMLNIDYATDSRKRWQVRAFAAANLRLSNDLKSYNLTVTPSFVPNKFLRLNLYNSLYLQPNRLANAPQIQVPNAVTRVRHFSLIQQYNIELFVSRKFYFSLSQRLNLDRYFFKAYRFNEQIDLEPVSYQYDPNPARNTNLRPSFAASWFFAPNSQLRLTYEYISSRSTNMGPDGTPLSFPLPADEIFSNSAKIFNMVLVWNLSKR